MTQTADDVAEAIFQQYVKPSPVRAMPFGEMRDMVRKFEADVRYKALLDCRDKLEGFSTRLKCPDIARIYRDASALIFGMACMESNNE